MYKCAPLKKEEKIQISFLYMCKQYRIYQNVSLQIVTSLQQSDWQTSIHKRQRR